MADDDYRELFLKWNPEADQEFVRRWLEQRNFSTSKMTTGLLLLGTRTTIEQTFSVNLVDIEPPLELPVPPELESHVASITLPRPRSYHG